MAFPSLIPETVIVGGIAVEIDMEPVFIRGIPFPFPHVPERLKIPPDVIEYAVQNHPDSPFMTGPAQPFEIGVGAKAAVNPAVIPRVVSVGVALEYRGKVNGIGPQPFQMVQPEFQPFQPVDRL